MSKSSRQIASKEQKKLPQSTSVPLIKNSRAMIHHAKFCYQNNQPQQVINCLSSSSHMLQTNSRYMLCMSYLATKNYQLAYLHLNYLRREKAIFIQNGTTYELITAICLKKLKKEKEALDVVNSGLNQQQKDNVDLLVLRAQLYKKTKRFKECKQDLTKAKELVMQSDKRVYILALLAQCLRILQVQDQCLSILEQLMSYYVNNKFRNKESYNDTSRVLQTPTLTHDNTPSLIIRNDTMNLQRYYLYVHCLLHFNHLAQALSVLKQIETLQNNLDYHSAQYHYLKGLYETKVGKKQQCILSWNEVFNCEINRKFIMLALQQLSLYHMQNRDFYEAYQCLNRGHHLLPQIFQKVPSKTTGSHSPKPKVHSKKFVKSQKQNFQVIKTKNPYSIVNLQRLAEGVTFLMKRKYQEGIAYIQIIDEKSYLHLSKYQQNFLNNLKYTGIGFGLFCLNKHKEALEIYKKIKVPSIDNENYVIQEDSEGIQTRLLAIKQHYYNVSLCQGILSSKNQQQVQITVKKFEQSLKYLLRSEPYFYIAVILVRKALKQLTHAPSLPTQILTKVLTILDTGLQMGENSHMYFYRSLIYVYLGLYAEGLEDLDKAIEKSEDNVAKYFFLRGAIFMLDKNYEQAIAEFTTCISIDEKFYDAYLERAKCQLVLGDQSSTAYMDLLQYPQHKEWQDIFGLYEKNYDHLIQNSNQQSTKQTANFMKGHFENAGPAGKLVLASLCKNFQEVIKLLDEAISLNITVGCLENDDIYMLKSYCLYKLGKWEQCQETLEYIEAILKHDEKNSEISEEDQRKLLIIKLNKILLTVSKGNFQQSIQLVYSLYNEVYEGNIYDQLQNLKVFLQKAQKNKQADNKKQTPNENFFTLRILNEVDLLSNYFPEQNQHNIIFHYYLPFPKQKTSVIQYPQYEQLLTDFTIEDVQNRPQPPWILRGKYGVIFTTQVQEFKNLSIYTEQDQIQRNKVKQTLQLGSELLSKLQKIVKKKKSNNQNKQDYKKSIESFENDLEGLE